MRTSNRFVNWKLAEFVQCTGSLKNDEERKKVVKVFVADRTSKSELRGKSDF